MRTGTAHMNYRMREFSLSVRDKQLISVMSKGSVILSRIKCRCRHADAGLNQLCSRFQAHRNLLGEAEHSGHSTFGGGTECKHRYAGGVGSR